MVTAPIRKPDTIKVKKEQLEAIVQTKADNMRNDIPKKMTYLNKKAEVQYQDMKIEADYISIVWFLNCRKTDLFRMFFRLAL